MTPFVELTGRAVALAMSNVDTDLIIPAAYLKTVRRSELGKHAFESLRADPVNMFDDPEWEAAAPILIALDNFGCGSSREHAVWALLDLGIRAVIARGFSDIFADNAFRNGLAAVELKANEVDQLLAAAAGAVFSISLEQMTVASSLGHRFGFEMDPFRRDCLMTGRDAISLTLESEAAITAYENRMRA